MNPTWKKTPHPSILNFSIPSRFFLHTSQVFLVESVHSMYVFRNVHADSRMCVRWEATILLFFCLSLFVSHSSLWESITFALLTCILFRPGKPSLAFSFQAFFPLPSFQAPISRSSQTRAIAVYRAMENYPVKQCDSFFSHSFSPYHSSLVHFATVSSLHYLFTRL